MYMYMYICIQCCFIHCSNINGTALACGIVAGAAALVLEQNPDLSPADVKQYLIKNATGVLNGTKKLIYVGKSK